MKKLILLSLCFFLGATLFASSGPYIFAYHFDDTRDLQMLFPGFWPTADLPQGVWLSVETDHEIVGCVVYQVGNAEPSTECQDAESVYGYVNMRFSLAKHSENLVVLDTYFIDDGQEHHLTGKELGY